MNGPELPRLPRPAARARAARAKPYGTMTTPRGTGTAPTREWEVVQFLQASKIPAIQSLSSPSPGGCSDWI